MKQALSKQILVVSQASRHELTELGEIGATFLALWLIVAVAVLIGLTVFWIL